MSEMHSEADVAQELREVRRLLNEAREAEDENAVVRLYAAQQALGWVLGGCGAPSDLELLLGQIAEGEQHV